MKKIFFIAISLIHFSTFAQNAAPSNAQWEVTSSLVKFKIKNAGFNVDGTFGGLSATINFDAAKLYGNSIEASIDSKTVNTSSSGRDAHLKKADYFDVEKYPKITMKATVFTKEKDGRYNGFFKLTMKDKTKDVMVPFVFSEKDGKGIFKGVFTINRLDFGVGESSMILSDNVTITIEVNVVRK